MFGKFFASTFTGSMMASGAEVFAVWGYVIAHAVESRVELNPRLLAAVIGSPVDRIEKAIETLCSPDPVSRNKEHDGRRMIREGEFQYFVTGHQKYRQMRDEADRREYNRIAKQKSRSKRAGVNQDVNLSNGLSSVSANTEAETEAETEADKYKGVVADATPKKSKTNWLNVLVQEGVAESVASDWLRIRREKRAPLTMTALDGIKREAAAAGMTLPQAVQVAAESGWQGFKAGWVTNQRTAVAQPVNRQEAIEQRNMAVVERWLNKDQA